MKSVRTSIEGSVLNLREIKNVCQAWLRILKKNAALVIYICLLNIYIEMKEACGGVVVETLR
jgi:hypothetical protein